MLFIIITETETIYPAGQPDLQRLNPSTSFPADITAMSDESLMDFDCYRVAQTTPPIASYPNQRLVELDPLETPEGFVQVWDVVDLTAQEMADRLKADTPTSISRLQFKLALSDNGWLQEVKDMIAALGPQARERVQIYWENLTSIEREGTLVQEIVARTSMTDLEMDEVFRDGVTLS
jgi:hypothetical protein